MKVKYVMKIIMSFSILTVADYFLILIFLIYFLSSKNAFLDSMILIYLLCTSMNYLNTSQILSTIDTFHLTFMLWLWKYKDKSIKFNQMLAHVLVMKGILSEKVIIYSLNLILYFSLEISRFISAMSNCHQLGIV